MADGRCLAVLQRYDRVAEFDRLRALRHWPNLAGRRDAGAYHEALACLDGRPVPCLPRSRRERRTLVRWLMNQGQREESVLRLP